MDLPASEAIEAAVRSALERHRRVVLAVSGGIDSMVLLHAAARVAPERVAAVATFDHGTGAHAERAAALVTARAAALGLPVRVGRGSGAARSEASWRAARWRFLHAVAGELAAPVATAHTRDDQVETVLMRALRGAGARGLAGLHAPGAVVRPLLELPRAAVAAYAAAHGVAYEDDPTNRDLRYFRNRVRHELLPALRAVRPSLPEELLDVARAAAAWRGELDAVVDRLGPVLDAAGALHVARGGLLGYDPEALRVLWAALAARAHVTLDRRGTWRVAEFTTSGASGSSIQLSGGWEVVRRRDSFVLRRLAGCEQDGRTVPLSGAEEVRFGRWRFRALPGGTADSSWVAALPADRPLTIRGWRPGDRMTAAGEAAPRRVKRFLRDAGIAGPDRGGWPVVLAGDQIVWIPGVRRSDAAAVRSGRPGVLVLCERTDCR